MLYSAPDCPEVWASTLHDPVDLPAQETGCPTLNLCVAKRVIGKSFRYAERRSRSQDFASRLKKPAETRFSGGSGRWAMGHLANGLRRVLHGLGGEPQHGSAIFGDVLHAVPDQVALDREVILD